MRDIRVFPIIARTIKITIQTKYTGGAFTAYCASAHFLAPIPFWFVIAELLTVKSVIAGCDQRLHILSLDDSGTIQNRAPLSLADTRI